MKKLILDTNFCMIPFQFRVDIFSEISRIVDAEYSLCAIDKTIDELDRIVANEKGKDKECARMALLLLKAKKVKIIKTKKNKDADDLIVDLASKDDIVCTLDIMLKKRLHEKKVKVVVMRQKKYLMMA